LTRPLPPFLRLFACLLLIVVAFQDVTGHPTIAPSKAKTSKSTLHAPTRSRSEKKRSAVRTTKITRSAVHSVKMSKSAKLAKSVNKATTKSNVVVMPLFGKHASHVSVLDRKLSGCVYYLASGHGGPDPGAVGRAGKSLLAEDEYAYDVTIRLARVLVQHGASVYMMVQDPNDGIRDGALLPIDYDEVAYPNQAISHHQTARLRQTTTAVNQQFARHKGYQRFVTLHVDSRSKGQAVDVFFYHHPGSKAGQKLAQNIHRKFQTNYKRYRPARPYRGMVSSRGNLYVVKNSHAPTVFIELGNIQNQLDQRRFVLADNRQALANWLYQGLASDYHTR
jgi:N-acetylmuramoyl-L-alanine amidase